MNPKTIHPTLSQNTPIQKTISKDILFKPNEVFNGKVIKNLPNHEVLVGAKGREFKAFSEVGLQEGIRYPFQVQSAENQIILKVLDDSSGLSLFLQKWDPAKLSRIFLNSLLADLIKEPEGKNENRPIERIINQLKTHLANILFKETEGGEESLKRLIHGSGMTWERKLSKALATGKGKVIKELIQEDLKGLLLSLKKALAEDRTSGQESELLSQKVEQSLQFIEQNQLFSSLALKAGIGPLFFIPGLNEEGLVRAEAFLKEKKKKEGGEFHLILFMEFSRLGPMEAHIAFKADKIHLQFYLTDQEKADYLISHQADLEAGFRRIGIGLSTFHCKVKKREELGLAEFLEKQGVTPSLHLVI